MMYDMSLAAEAEQQPPNSCQLVLALYTPFTITLLDPIYIQL